MTNKPPHSSLGTIFHNVLDGSNRAIIESGLFSLGFATLNRAAYNNGISIDNGNYFTGLACVGLDVAACGWLTYSLVKNLNIRSSDIKYFVGVATAAITFFGINIAAEQIYSRAILPVYEMAVPNRPADKSDISMRAFALTKQALTARP